VKVVVTGAAGFLGSNLVAKLLAEGHDVIGIDNLSMGRLENLSRYMQHPRFQFMQRDVMEPSTFAALPHACDCVVHLAAFKIPRYGKALSTLRINQRGTENALDYAVTVGSKCVIASTSDVYGRNPVLPFNEDDNLVIGSSKVPRWAYAVSKLYDEHLALAYAEETGIPVTVLRFFGSYGPNQPLSWWGGPPPVFIDAVLKGQPIPIHGNGLQTRSFTFVSDTVEGIYASIVNPAANGEIFNIGSTEEVTILQLAQTIKAVSGTPGELDVQFIPYESFTGKDYQDVMRRVPDVTRCQEILGVRAVVSLEEGLRRTIEWQRQVRTLQAVA
jgi:UDP-glucose 4-epimerase